MLVFFSGMARINSLGNSDGKKPHNIEFRICFQIAEFNFKNKCIINVTTFINRNISRFTLNYQLTLFPEPTHISTPQYPSYHTTSNSG